ncbi:MAG TPA: Stk1 family PASTA domain-containing Ser/Thr kinase [Actinomycetota bacterium]|nr:Stk1 family PASTA domain-containing Ser/Thr kinase [Actinomycetota bacterium]
MSVVETTIEGRYQVITRIASGGMGEVYRARDAVLGREVAVKVLHPHFAGDRGFVERFRREARAAAVLNHPNVVGVYDWGSTDGTYFMVMEFVPGVNLRSVLAERGRLEPAQAVEVCLQVLEALEHAHSHGIVHRDVKPENILITPEGTVKVTDFGLARAYADSSVSQTEGTVTGTVHYLAPEQIEGRRADPRTDLYALGIVLYELLTGEPPYDGETALAIAYQHLSGRVPAPSSVVPGLPRQLDRAVLWATEKDPDRRPRSARALAAELRRVAPSLPRAPQLREVAARVPPLETVPPDRAPTVTIPRAVSRSARRVRALRRALWALAAVLLLAAGAWAAWEYAVPHYTRLPRVVGLPIEQAQERLRSQGFAVEVGPGVHSSSVEPGVVVETRPPPGARVREGATVVLIPSLGPELLPVPDVVGMAEERARRAIVEAGFQPRVRRAYDEAVPRGRVVQQSPEADVELERGAVVTITVSRGPAPVEVPDLRGKPASEAEITLEALGFKVRREERYSDTVEEGLVIETVPPGGELARRGATVTMVVSLGPQTFPMPDVVGMDTREARDRLESLGLEVRVERLSNFSGRVVLLQFPPPGAMVRRGDEVTIYV